jgi:glycerol uptake facilitator protein
VHSLGQVFVSEVLGTAVLTLLGCGVVANALLRDTKGRGPDWLLISFGWAIGVYAGVYVAFNSGAHLNPAVTLGILASGADTYSKGVPITVGSTFTYFAGEFLGAFLGAVGVWLSYRQHFDLHDAPAEKLGVFSTGPQIRSTTWNLVTETIATFLLVYVILVLGKTPTQVGPLAVALLVLGIGMSLGGPTGYAINPARDLGPRVAHAVLPIRGKGSNDWGYAWIPVVGPVVGGVLAGLFDQIVN